ncbi:unnamed protein product [Closterium sp. NIES-53]
MLPYLFPDLAAFATVADLITHLRTSDARYRAALPTEDHFLSLCPTELTVDLLEERLTAAEKSILAVAASRGDPRAPFFEGCSPVPLLPSVASAAVVDLVGTEDVGAASAPCGRRRNSKGKGGKGGGGDDGGGGGGGGRGGSGGFVGGGGGGGGSGSGGGGSGNGGGGGGGGSAGRGGAAQRGGFGGSQCQQQQRSHETPSAQQLREWYAGRGRSGGNVAIFDLDFDAILAAMYAVTDSAEGDCYLCVPPNPGIEAATLGASESAAPGTGESAAPSAAPPFTPLSRPVAVSLADPSGGPVLAHSSTVLPCPAALSGLLSGLHLPSFSTNLVSGADLQDTWVNLFTSGGSSIWSGVSQVDPVEPVEGAVDSGAARGGEPAGAGTGCAEPGVAESEGAEPGGAEPERVEPGGAEPGGAEFGGAEPGGAESGGAAGAGAAGGAAGAGAAGAAGAAGPGGAGAGGNGAVGGPAGVGAAGGAGAAGPGGACTGGTGAAGAGGAAGVGAVGVGGAGGTGAVATGGAAGAGVVGDTGAGGAAGVVAGDPGAEERRSWVRIPVCALRASQCGGGVRGPLLQPASPLSGPSPYSGPTRGLTEHREPESRPASPESRPASPESRPQSPVCAVRTGRRVLRQRPPSVPGTHSVTLRPSTAPQRVPLPSPPASSLPDGPDTESDSLRAASPTVTLFLATAVTDPSFESTAASALVAELVDLAAACRLDYATSLVAESESAFVCPPSVGGECALGTDVLEDRQEEFECFAAAVPHLVSMLFAPVGDPDAPDIPTPHYYAEAIEGPYSSHWQAAMDTEMASWKSTGTYVDEVPPPGANIVSGMWIFRVKRPSRSPLVFKARYVARGFTQRQGRDYELHSPNFSTAFLQGSLHEEIWLRCPPGFTGSFPAGTQWSLRRPLYGLRQAPHEWHDTLRTTLAALGFAPSTADPSLFLHTDTTLPPLYVLVYVDDLVFATADTEALAHVLRRFGFMYSSPQSTPRPTGHSLSAPPSNESVEPSGPYPELVGCLITSGLGLVLGGRARVVLTSHADASWSDDLTTQQSSQGYTFSLGSGSVSWLSTRSSSVLSSNCEDEIYAGAMAAQELRWLTYLLTDLGEPPRSPPMLYVDNKAMIALCQEHRLEHRTKHITLRYFLAQELQHRGQLRLAYVASRANTADVFTKALQPCDHQLFCTVLGLLAFPFLTGLVTSYASDSAAPGAGEAALSGTVLAQVLHTFTPDSVASRSFFCDCTTLSPLSWPVAVSLPAPSMGPVLAQSSTVLPCSAVPSGSLSCLHLASFSTNLVATLGQVFAVVSRTGLESAPCSCRLLSHQTHLWHHRLGHPSLPRLRGMASRVLVTGLPPSLPPLPSGLAPTCVPCVEGRQRATPHSSEFPPTEAPLQTLHMDVWGPARVRGQGHERKFLLVVDDYSRYTTVFPLRRKGEVTEVLIDWIRAARCQLSESFGSDLPVLRLHFDRGGEFSCDLLRAFCRAEGIRLTLTLPASPQQNGIAERRIGMVMDVARTSMIHAAAPHFLWPFAVQYAAHQINLQPWVSVPETTPTLRWTGKVGEASAFCVWGSRDFVRDLSADKLSSRAVPYVFLGFLPDAPGWQFYHPTSRRILSSQDLMFNKSVPYYRLFPYRTATLPPPLLFLAPDAVELVEVAVDSGAARVAESVDAGSGGTEPKRAEPGGAESGGAEPGVAESGGAEPEGAEPMCVESGGAAPGGPSAVLLELVVLRALEVLLLLELQGVLEPNGPGRACTGGTGAAGPGGAARAGAAGGAEAGGTIGPGATRGAGPSAAGAAEASSGPGGAGAGGAAGAGAPGGAGVGASGAPRGAGGAGGATGVGAHAEGARVVPAGSGGAARPRPYFVPLLEQVLRLPPSTGPAPSLECPQPVPSESQLQPASPLHAPSPYTGPTVGLTERREPECCHASPVPAARTGHPGSRQRPPPVLGQTRWLCSTAASALVAELVEFPAHCRLDYATSLVAESAFVCPPSVGGECTLSTDVLEDMQEEFQCFATALPHLVSMLLAPEGDPDAPDIPTPRSYAEAIEGPYSSQWQTPMDAEMASWKSTGTYVDEVPPPEAKIVNGMWIFRVKRPTGSPPVFKPWRPVYGLRQAPPEWHDTLRTTLAALGFAPSTADPTLLCRRSTSSYHLGQSTGHHYLDSVAHGAAGPSALQLHVLQATPLSTRHSLSALPSDESVEPSGPYPKLVGCLMYLMTCTQPDLAYPLSILARYVAPGRHRPEHMDAAKRVLRYLCSTMGMGLGYTLSLGSGSISWRSTRLSSVLSSSCEAEIYAVAMAAQELRWLTYLLADLGEAPRSPPYLNVDNKVMLALCQEDRLEHRTKHIALRYFLARELQQRGQLRLAYVATRANTADIFTKALQPCDHQRYCTMLGLVPTWPHLLTS